MTGASISRAGPPSATPADRQAIYGALLESSDDPLWVVDSGFHLLDANRAYFELGRAWVAGATRAVEEKGAIPLSPGPDAWWLAQYRRGLSGERFRAERAFDLCGTRRVFEIGFTPVRGADGAVDGLAVVARDISARAGLLEALRRSEERFRGLVESTGDWVWEVNEKGEYTYASPRVRELLGYEPSELIGRTPFELMPPDEAHRVRGAFLALVADRRPIVMLENVNLHRDGRRLVLETSGVPFFDAWGELRGYRGIDRDITARKSIEEQLRRLNDALEQRVAERTAALTATLKELESFSYSASHDLRAPLRGIEGFATLLDDEFAASLDARGRDYLSRIRRAAQRMAQLIDDLIEFARLSRQPLARARTDLSQLAAAVVAELREAEPSRAVRVWVQPGLIADADPRLARVLLANLIGNAWKFTREVGEANIEFRRAAAGSRCRFEVRDSGVGFDMAYGDKLFKPFQRLHAADRFEGNGIGLAICARIAERHGGEIRAESAPGMGACFAFSLGS